MKKRKAQKKVYSVMSADDALLHIGILRYIVHKERQYYYVSDLDVIKKKVQFVNNLIKKCNNGIRKES